MAKNPQFLLGKQEGGFEGGLAVNNLGFDYGYSVSSLGTLTS